VEAGMNLFERAAQSGDAIALDDTIRRRTWAELLDRAYRLAHLLGDTYGVGPGGHVAMIMGNRVEYAEVGLPRSSPACRSRRSTGTTPPPRWSTSSPIGGAAGFADPA